MDRKPLPKKPDVATAEDVIGELSNKSGDNSSLTKPYHGIVSAPLNGTYYDPARADLMGEIGLYGTWQSPYGDDGSYTYDLLVPLSEVKKVAETGPEDWRKHFTYLADQMEQRRAFVMEQHAKAAAEAAKLLGQGFDQDLDAPPAAQFRRRNSAPKP